MKLENGFGSVSKEQGNRRKPYRARVTTGWSENGKQIRINIGYFESKKDAMIAIAQYHDNPFHKEAQSITVIQLYNMWYEVKKSKISISSQKTYQWAINIAKDLWDMPFVDVRLYHLQDIVDTLGNKWSSKKKFKGLFSQLYDFAIANDISNKNYAKYIDLGEHIRSQIHRPFTEEEVTLLWNNINRMDYIDVLLVYIYTGFRPSELLDIECDTGVNLKENYLQGGAKTEAGKNRIVPIHPRILPIIKKWYNKGGRYLIKNTYGEQMTYFNWRNEKFCQIMEQLELDHKPHDTRHTFSTLLDNAGANKVCRQRLLGHASKDVTDAVYTHKDIKELRKTIELLP